MHVLAHFSSSPFAMFLLACLLACSLAYSSLGIPPPGSVSTNPCCRRRRSLISVYNAAPATNSTITITASRIPAAENDFNLHQDDTSVHPVALANAEPTSYHFLCLPHADTYAYLPRRLLVDQLTNRGRRPRQLDALNP
ncbi:hypothetical protein LX32DRAFT_117574 [Colletotrichum zoysiae]|uniref:Uncharacterized protein n=1 Tax=Colletotrichum zoysiae TaxID=1216348 RepID=A0AAD9HRY3_9PEZI|nr:hypothetical protein LX32DRAFT_117574 [Colletotrichum zoysiae]